MPIYEYQCKACGHRLEALQKISEEPLKECPHCHEPALDKLVSAAGFQLKGSGWYLTDYKNKSQPTKKDDTTSTTNTDTKSKSTDSKSE